ncbi:hypothetical protein HAHE_22120 [Haloferula helveola]|uniref:Uncharacterized protein n=1 Tax=Haloferula helveola TaxID=490095 RepID=A0ABM7RAB8_9BACT|nr:hypothetical protein HAHE_22120 [Haloferula helveola]
MNNSSQSIRGILIAIVAIAMSIWLGVSIITSQVETLVQAGVVGVVLICVLLGRRIWVLVPIGVALNIPVIRGLGTTEISEMLFIGFTSLMLLMRRAPMKWKIGELDFWAVAVLVMVAQVYLRNPVGLNIFGAGTVGARPYFMVALAFVTMVFLGMYQIRARDMKWVFWLSALGTLLSGPLNYLRVGLGGGNPADLAAEGPSDPGATDRKGYLNTIATEPARMLSSWRSPLRAVFHPIWAPLVLLTFAAAAYSGFRNTVAMVGLIYLAGICYRGGLAATVISVSMGAVLLGGLAVINVAAPLPPNVQRALSPFPGTWEERYVTQAENSTEWRVEMWKSALFTDYWIQNKVLGDGLGMTADELRRSEEIKARGILSGRSGLTSHQEAIMVNGDYHSGPVQTVRTVGYVGLAVLLLAQIRLAVHTHRLIRRCHGTEWYPVALYFGIPLVIYPIFFVLIFGTFGTAGQALFLGIGMVKMLHANLPVPEFATGRRSKLYQPLLTRNTGAASSH